MTRICNKCGEYEHDCFCQQPMTLLERLKNYIGIMSTHQRERMGGELLIEATSELEALQKAAGFCDKHKPDGGARNCLVCSCEKLSHALDQISYAIGEPNKMGVSYYSTTYNEQQVVEAVKTLRAQNREMRETLQLARKQLLERSGLDKDSDNRVALTINKALSQPEAGKV